MKKFAEKAAALLLAAVMIVCLASCGDSEAEKKVRIGILQFAPHASLDNCREGILKALEDGGYTDGENCVIEIVNGQGESETNQMAAQSFVNKDYDIIIAIATPAVLPCYAAAKQKNIPVIFSAVSDPVGAGIASSLDNPQSGASGTSDSLNYPAQLGLIRAFQPDAKTIGILYTTSEANSLAQLKEYQSIARDYGFEISAQGVTDASEIASAASSLISSGIDCICNLTDNNIVNNFSVVTAAADPAGIPCYGSEEEQVALYGCVASETLDYVSLGYTTGQMAVSVLSGEADINSLPVYVVSDSEPVYSEKNMEKFGLRLPEEYSGARSVD